MTDPRTPCLICKDEGELTGPGPMGTSVPCVCSPSPDRMPAGRHLDALVAERVFGWAWGQDDPTAYSTSFRPGHRYIVPPDCIRDSLKIVPAGTDLPLAKEWYGNVPRYSTAIAEAWSVVTHLLADGWHVDLGVYPERTYCSVVCSRGPCERHGNLHHDWHGVEGVTADTTPLALCRAALAAVGGTVLGEPPVPGVRQPRRGETPR